MNNTEFKSRWTSKVPIGAALPSLAVMIPTLNRPLDLTAAVKTLLDQTILPQQLIIIDQSPGSESEFIIRKLLANNQKQSDRLTLNYTRDPKISGLTAARNVALRQNECDIFLFLDDDVELEPDFIEKLLEGYMEDPEITGISGIITNYKPLGFPSRAWQWFFVHGPFRDERQSLYHRADLLREAGRLPVTRLGGGLMSFRTSCIGGLRFDENLRGAAEGEDVDFCLHLPAGARLEIAPGARLVHNASTTGRKDEHWIASVVRGNVYLYYRNWRSGILNRFAYVWLMTGFAILALIGTFRHRSPSPWRSFTSAMRHGKEVGLGIVSAN